MAEDILTDSIKQHLSLLETLVNTIIGVALISAWAGFQKTEQISVLSLDVKRKHAFFVLGAIFATINLTCLMIFFRIGDILRMLSGEYLIEGLTILATHRWILNPFAFFGDTWFSYVHSNMEFGLLITVWWIGYSTLMLLLDAEKTTKHGIVLACFLGVGLTSMGSIQYVYFVILTRLPELSVSFQASILDSFLPRTIFVFAGIILGGLIFTLTQTAQKKNL